MGTEGNKSRVDSPCIGDEEGGRESSLGEERVGAMHSSISLSLESGLERGMPWGHELYTFVTSAAGHMMRTLQKPRKNRPSKRQVNHRRFLHNMIQRKFADIEAANHRLASVLYFKADEKTPDAHDPPQINPATPKTTPDGELLQKSPEIGRKTQPESKRKSCPKSRKGKHQKSDQKQLEFTSLESIPLETMHFYGDDEIVTDALFAMDAQEESSLFQLDMDSSPSFSPELSPLSIDSCDFAVQMLTGVSPCTPGHCNGGVEEIVEGNWAEIIDLLGDRRGGANVEDYLESVCGCQSDAEWGKDDEEEEFFYERAQCRYDTDQAVAANHLENFAPLFTNDNALGMNSFASSNTNGIIQNQQPDYVSYPCTSHQRLPPQSQRSGRHELNPAPFEGVAQSYSAPLQNAPRFSIATPPYEGDWLFTDILTDHTTSLC